MANKFTQTSLKDLRPAEAESGALFVALRRGTYTLHGNENRPTDQELADNELVAMRRAARVAINAEASRRMEDKHTGARQLETYDLIDQVFRTLIGAGVLTRPNVNQNMPPELDGLRLIDAAARDMRQEMTAVCDTPDLCLAYMDGIASDVASAPRTVNWPA